MATRVITVSKQIEIKDTDARVTLFVSDVDGSLRAAVTVQGEYSEVDASSLRAAFDTLVDGGIVEIEKPKELPKDGEVAPADAGVVSLEAEAK